MNSPASKPVKLDSSHLDSVKYNETERTLEITFNSGQTYKYHNVSGNEYAGLLTANSPGSYFSERLKGKRFTKK